MSKPTDDICLDQMKSTVNFIAKPSLGKCICDVPFINKMNTISEQTGTVRKIEPQSREKRIKPNINEQSI